MIEYPIIRTLYIHIASMLLACIYVWAGSFKKINKLSALILIPRDWTDVPPIIDKLKNQGYTFVAIE